MTDRHRAYAVLGLESGATLDQIEEAYRDLKAVWHPDRFLDSPELREKAAEKQKAVDEAYAVLRDYHSREKSPAGGGVSLEDAGIGRRPSILDDTLSERMGRSKRRRLPVWIILFVLVAVAVVVSFLSWSPVEVERDSQKTEEERIVADVRAARTRAEEQDTSAAKETAEPVSAQRMETSTPDRKSEPTPEPLVTPKRVEPSIQVVKPEKTVSPSRPPSEEQAPPAMGEQAPPALGTEENKVVTDETSGEGASEAVVSETQPVISELAQRSFQVLRAKSDLADQLVEGGFAEFRYKDWKAVERSPTEVYVDLVAEVVSEGRELHFVWAVDLEAQSVKPMSQAARDLRASKR